MRHRRRRRSKRGRPEVNLNSCLDLFLNILLFFVFATEIAVVDAIDIQVPISSQAKSQDQGEQKAILFITKENKYVTDEGTISLEELPGWLSQKQGEGVESFILRGDQTSDLQAIIDALGACRKMGIDKVKIETRQPDDKP